MPKPGTSLAKISHVFGAALSWLWQVGEQPGWWDGGRGKGVPISCDFIDVLDKAFAKPISRIHASPINGGSSDFWTSEACFVMQSVLRTLG